MKLIKIKMNPISGACAPAPSSEKMKEMGSENLWCPGNALMDNGNKLKIERIRTIDGFEYRYNGSMIDKKTVITFMPTEWIFNRDS